MVVVEVRMGEGSSVSSKITFKQNKLEDHIYGSRPVDIEMATVRDGCGRMQDGHRKKKVLTGKGGSQARGCLGPKSRARLVGL